MDTNCKLYLLIKWKKKKLWGESSMPSLNPEYYRQRLQIIEPVKQIGWHQFGTIKRHWHFDYTITRGIYKVLRGLHYFYSLQPLKKYLYILIYEFKAKK